jgi:hypothetical protein
MLYQQVLEPVVSIFVYPFQKGWAKSTHNIPIEFLCLIHDKMDHTKTTIPRMQRHTKATAGLGQILISLTGMLTHGHGDGAYTHYATAFWPGDSNFTISSIFRVVQALERPLVRSQRCCSLRHRRTRFLQLSCMGNRVACPRFLMQIVIPLLLRFPGGQRFHCQRSYSSSLIIPQKIIRTGL